MNDATFGVPAALSGTAPARQDARSSDGDGTPDTVPDAIDPEAFRKGEDECFRAVLDRFGGLIRRVVRSYADCDDDRDDLYQEVCIRILEQRGKYREDGSMGGWIAAIARNVARNWRVSRSARESAKGRYATAIVPMEAAGHLTADPSKLLNYKQLLTNVKQVLAALPDRQAEAFRLVHIEGYSPREAAGIVGVETATVRSNLRHARKKLREQLAELRDELS